MVGGTIIWAGVLYWIKRNKEEVTRVTAFIPVCFWLDVIGPAPNIPVAVFSLCDELCPLNLSPPYIAFVSWLFQQQQKK